MYNLTKMFLIKKNKILYERRDLTGYSNASISNFMQIIVLCKSILVDTLVASGSVFNNGTGSADFEIQIKCRIIQSMRLIMYVCTFICIFAFISFSVRDVNRESLLLLPRWLR